MDSRLIRLALIRRRVDAAIANLAEADRLLTEAVIGENDDLAYSSWIAGVEARALREGLTNHAKMLKSEGQRGTGPATTEDER